MEGNIFETVHRHAIRYFSSIDIAEAFTSQRFKQLSMSDEVVSKLNLSHCIALLNTICRIGNNGAKCANCEMQEDSMRNSYYVPLRPKSNEDHLCKQVALRINVCPVNHLGTHRIHLTEFKDSVDLEKHRRKQYGYCGSNCNLRHNLSSTLAMMCLNLRTQVDDTVHWPRQNYEKDHEANVCGPRCGCHQEWRKYKRLHNVSECGWMQRSGDVICAEYDKDTNYGLNTIKSFCDLAIRTTCHCLPSWSLLKHGSLMNRDTLYYGHPRDGKCEWSLGCCKNYCSTCVHYCGIQHGC